MQLDKHDIKAIAESRVVRSNRKVYSCCFGTAFAGAIIGIYALIPGGALMVLGLIGTAAIGLKMSREQKRLFDSLWARYQNEKEILQQVEEIISEQEEQPATAPGSVIIGVPVRNRS